MVIQSSSLFLVISLSNFVRIWIVFFRRHILCRVYLFDRFLMFGSGFFVVFLILLFICAAARLCSLLMDL